MADSPNPSSENPLEAIYRCYAVLAAALPLHPDSGLGGKLLYAGAIDQASRHLLYAANVAGAASLAASADADTQRQAMRDGVVDFLVTSLEEALRILKNEIRKRQPVSVAVGIHPELLAAQMLDRGVLPDLLASGAVPNLGQRTTFLSQGALLLQRESHPDRGKFVTWSPEKDFARWLPRLDAFALAALPKDDFLRRRWLALAPRYLGRLAQRLHGVGLSPEEQTNFGTGIQQLLSQNEHTGDPAPQITISG